VGSRLTVFRLGTEKKLSISFCSDKGPGRQKSIQLLAGT